MSAAKHTPGPWRLAEDRERSITNAHFVWSDAETCEEREDGSPYCVATVHERADAATLEANARLIAAAPELYDALAELLEIVEPSLLTRAATKKARAALASVGVQS